MAGGDGLQRGNLNRFLSRHSLGVSVHCYLVAKNRSGGEVASPPEFTVVWLTPQLVPRFRPRGASFRERARPLRKLPRLRPVPWPRPLPSLARGARCGSTPCRFRQG